MPGCPAGKTLPVTDIPAAVIKYRKADAPAGTSLLTAGTIDWTFNQETKSLEKGEITVSGLEVGESYSFQTTVNVGNEPQTVKETVLVTGVEMSLSASDKVEDFCQ